MDAFVAQRRTDTMRALAALGAVAASADEQSIVRRLYARARLPDQRLFIDHRPRAYTATTPLTTDSHWITWWLAGVPALLVQL